MSAAGVEEGNYITHAKGLQPHYPKIRTQTTLLPNLPCFYPAVFCLYIWSFPLFLSEIDVETVLSWLK